MRENKVRFTMINKNPEPTQTLNRHKPMELLKEIDTVIEELKDEAKNLEIAESKEEEKEALKEMLDALMRGARQVQEKLDQFNDRRYR